MVITKLQKIYFFKVYNIDINYFDFFADRIIVFEIAMPSAAMVLTQFSENIPTEWDIWFVTHCLSITEYSKKFKQNTL